MNAETIIIGGGVIGLSIARELRLRGATSVAVLERGLVGHESSYAAAGMLALQAETDRADRFFDFCRRSNSVYRDFADALLSETGIDVEYDGTGTLYLAFDEADAEELRARHSWQSAAGLNITRLERKDVLDLEPSVNESVEEGLLFPDDCQVENRKLVDALAAFARANGITIIEGCDVVSVKTEGSRVTGVRTVTTEHGCGNIILASGAWTSLLDVPGRPLEGFKPVKGEILSFGTSRGLLRHVVYSPRGYLVPRTDGRILAGATVEDAGFDKTTTSAAEECIQANAFEILPKLGELEIRDRWAGLRPWVRDGRPLIGAVPGFENMIVAAGHYRNGILLAPATAELVADLVSGSENEFKGDFIP